MSISVPKKQFGQTTMKTVVISPDENLKTYISNLDTTDQFENGNFMSFDGEQLTSTTVFNDGICVCSSEDEFANMMANAPKFKDVMDTWKQFGHAYDSSTGLVTMYRVPSRPNDGFSASSGAIDWIYDDTLKSVKMNQNVAFYSGFVSPQKYSDYDIIIRCSSSNGDDDFNGFVAAFAEDFNDKGEVIYQHTLSFIRTPNYGNAAEGKTHHWFCIVDAVHGSNSDGLWAPGRDTEYDLYKQFLLWNSPDLNNESEGQYGWSSMKNGTFIHVKRNKNKFFAQTTKFRRDRNATVDDLGYDVEIDLDQIINEYIQLANNVSDQKTKRDLLEKVRVLKLFLNSASIGYSTMSQPSSVYENVKFVLNTKPVILVDENGEVVKVAIFDDISSTWNISTTIPELFKKGQITYNDTVANLAYMNNDNTVTHLSIPKQQTLVQLEKFLNYVVEGQ